MTDSFMKSYRKPFSGRVIDGPFEGEFIESDSPYFEGLFQQAVSGFMYSDMPSASIEIDRAIYKWLPSYRAWAWWQR